MGEEIKARGSARIRVDADGESPKTVTARPGTASAYYGNETVSASNNDGTIAAGQTITLTQTKFFRTAGTHTRLNVADIQQETVHGRLNMLEAAVDDLEEGVAWVFNVRSYGAVGNRVTDDTAAFLACIAAAGAAAGVLGGAAVFVPSGHYLLTDELVLPAGVTLVGAAVASTALCWQTDLGAGQYAIRLNSNPWGTALSGLWIQGPGFFTAFDTVGEHPCEMRGVDMAAGSIIRDCQIVSFDINIRITQNHEEIYNCKISGGYYNIYFDSAVSAADQVFENIQFPRGLYSHVAIHPNNQIGGVHWTGCHFADAPYAFYGEAGDGGAQMIVQSIFLDCAFEGCGNGWFYDAKRTRSITATFIGCGEGSAFASSPIVGEPERASFDAYSVNLITDGGFPVACGSEAVIYCVGPFYCRWDASDVAIGVARAAGKPLVKAPQAYAATGSYTSGLDLCEWEMFQFRNDAARGLAAQGELVELQAEGHAVQRYDATAGVPAGVVLHTAVAVNAVPVAVSGSVSVKTTDATLGKGEWAKPATDTGKRGELIAATGPTDGPAVGYTRADASDGVISTRLRGLV